jgi:hypothetical protein
MFLALASCEHPLSPAHSDASDPPNAGPASAFMAIQVAAGGEFTCALKPDGTLACWGFDQYGQSTPPPGIFQQVAAGYEHACGVRTDGTTQCWGEGEGEGSYTYPSGSFRQVTAGFFHTCWLRTDGTVVCRRSDYPTPSGTFQQVATGYDHTCGVRTDGTVTCWGSNSLGESTPPPAPSNKWPPVAILLQKTFTLSAIPAGFVPTVASRAGEITVPASPCHRRVPLSKWPLAAPTHAGYGQMAPSSAGVGPGVTSSGHLPAPSNRCRLAAATTAA